MRRSNLPYKKLKRFSKETKSKASKFTFLCSWCQMAIFFSHYHVYKNNGISSDNVIAKVNADFFYYGSSNLQEMLKVSFNLGTRTI